MKKLLNSAVRAFLRFSERLFEANQITLEVAQLNHLSDSELRRMGLVRSEITHHVARRHAYI